MPYIPQLKRDELQAALCQVAQQLDAPGELNYCITRLCLSMAPKNYAEWNAIVGVLECCKLEMYRRAVAAYEGGAITRNGDIPEYERMGK